MNGFWAESWLAQLDEAIFRPTTVLWLVFAVIAAMTLIGSLTRRRRGLTDSLRDFVSRQQRSGDGADPVAGEPAESRPAESRPAESRPDEPRKGD